MPRHSPCALYSLTFKRYVWFSYSWIMQAITDSTTQNCNCYPLLLQKCSTIKNSQLSSRFLWKTSLLPCFSSHLIHCSVFKVQFPIPFETRCKRSIPWTLSSILKSLSASIVLVEIVGIEPATSCLQGRRSPSWAISPYHLHFKKSGGPEWARTTDLTIISRTL